MPLVSRAGPSVDTHQRSCSEADRLQILRQCLDYPSPKTFERVIGLTNRSLAKDHFLIPEANGKSEVHSGLDLSKGVESVVKSLKSIKLLSTQRTCISLVGMNLIQWNLS